MADIGYNQCYYKTRDYIHWLMDTVVKGRIANPFIKTRKDANVEDPKQNNPICGYHAGMKRSANTSIHLERGEESFLLLTRTCVPTLLSYWNIN